MGLWCKLLTISWKVFMWQSCLKTVPHLKGPIHDSDLQSQLRFPTATSTKFPVYGLRQPQPPPWLADRCCGCCWSEFSDIWRRFGHQRRGPALLLSENWERLNRSVAACVGTPSTATATAIWLHIAVAIEIAVVDEALNSKLNLFWRIIIL